MRIGIACDLRADQTVEQDAPDDILEEYDSQSTVDAIAAALRDLGHEPVELGGGRRFLEWALSRAGSVDLVFNIAEGRGSRSREAHVPAVCEMLGIAFTGSDPLTLALSLDKALAKRVAASHGVATAPFCLIDRPESLDQGVLPGLPAIAKLNAEGSSMGVRRNAVCATEDALKARVRELFAAYRAPVLVERFVGGLEVTVGILGTGDESRVAGVMEIAPRRVTSTPFVYSLEIKRSYRDEVDYYAPPRLAASTIDSIERCALAAYRALGCRDVGRVDLRLDEHGEPCLIEVNPLPGLHPEDGDFPVLWELLGRGYNELIAAIVESARRRKKGPERK